MSIVVVPIMFFIVAIGACCLAEFLDWLFGLMCCGGGDDDDD